MPKSMITKDDLIKEEKLRFHQESIEKAFIITIYYCYEQN